MKFNNYTKAILTMLFGSLILSAETQAQRIAAGGWHSVALCSDSTVKAFGENATGQLGDGTTTDQNSPVPVLGLTGIINVSAGGDQLEAHSMALKSDGTVWCWGSNLYGGLGNGTTNSSNVPVQALTLANVSAIAAGGWHSVALKTDSTVWTWGWNTDGQLGDGTTTDKTIGTVVTGLTGVMAIASGTYHVLALKSDGTVWAWGDNVSGQLGNGNTTDSPIPVQVAGLTDVVKITAGRFFSLAIKSDGTVWTWGENLYGQLGNGTTTDSPTPVQVTGLAGITSATAATGAFHCMAVKNDNTVWAWGRNTYGNLGNGTVANSSLPVQMQNVSDVAELAAGTNFSILYKTDGTFWGCGRNSSGQLGDGTVLQRNTIAQATALCPILTPVGIHEAELNKLQHIVAYPNPSSNGIFSLDLTSLSSNTNPIYIEVYDVVGAKVYEKQLENPSKSSSVSLDLSRERNQMYYLVVTSNGQRMTKKLLIQ